MTETRQRLLITNDSDSSPLDVSVFSKNCGCIAMTLDDNPLNVDQPFTIQSGKSCQISLTLPVPAPGVFDANNARLHFSRTSGLSVERVVVARASVYRDLVVNPKRIEVVTGSSSNAPPSKVVVDWVHSIHDKSPLPEAIVSESLAGRIDLTFETLEKPEAIGTTLQRDRMQLLVSNRGGSSLEEIDEPTGLLWKRPNSTATESVAVHIVDGRSLLTPKELSFGHVQPGMVSRRAFVVRAANSEPLGSLTVSTSGLGNVECHADKDLGNGCSLVTATFRADAPGEYQGWRIKILT